METAVPVSYGFGGPHDLAAVSHRRLMGPPPDTPMPPYYASPPLPYAAHLHAPAAYGFGHILNTSHASSYQPFYAAAAASPLAHRLPDHPAAAPLARSSAAATPTTTIPTTSSSSSSPPSTAAANGLARLIESHPARLDPDHHQHQHHQHHHQHPTHHLHHQQHSHSRPASIIHQHKPDDHQQQQHQHQHQHQQPTGDSRPGKQPLRVKPDIEFSTEVDTLMKTIQSKPKLAQPQLPPLHQFTTGVPGWSYPGPGAAVSAAPPPPPPPPLVQQQQQQQQQQSSSSLSSASMFAPPQPDRPPPSKQKSRRKYECTLPNCRKSFYQKTHLDIHMRAHTGDKPFICKEAGCGQRFSQLGNLKTHERRHTGEKPYSCDICNKKFAQRGNVRAHKITHEKAKPFICRLDDCGKQFTQLGNLKSHQNKFHAQTLRDLTIRFSTLSETERLAQHDIELWEYFATLYKNSNKGIKGRGKDRRVSSTAKQLRHPPPPPPSSAPSSSSHPHPHPHPHALQHPHPPAPSSSASSSASLSSSSSTAGSSVSSGMDEMGGTATSAAAAGSLDDEKHRMSMFHHRSSYLSTPSSDEVDFHEHMYSRGPH